MSDVMSLSKRHGFAMTWACGHLTFTHPPKAGAAE